MLTSSTLHRQNVYQHYESKGSQLVLRRLLKFISRQNLPNTKKSQNNQGKTMYPEHETLQQQNIVPVTSQTTKTTRAEEAVSRKIAPIHFVFMHPLYNQHHPDRARKAAQFTIRILDFECPVVIIKDKAYHGFYGIDYSHPLCFHASII